jgi:hypothetical protein
MKRRMALIRISAAGMKVGFLALIRFTHPTRNPLDSVSADHGSLPLLQLPQQFLEVAALAEGIEGGQA